MKKLIVSVLAAGAVAASAFVLAAEADDTGQNAGGAHMAQSGFIFDAKLAGMKAELKLTADQEKLWPAFESVVREAHMMRMQMMRDHREADKAERPSPIVMMTEMSDHLAKAADELKKIADAAKPLYDTFDDTQKRQFGPLLMMLRQGGGPSWDHAQHGSADMKPL